MKNAISRIEYEKKFIQQYRDWDVSLFDIAKEIHINFGCSSSSFLDIYNMVKEIKGEEQKYKKISENYNI